jgi:tetratricopeptide (TPR) repeat protein
VRKLNPLVGQDLDTIVMKCLEKKPDRRYASAKEFADDLTRYLEGDAITAHPPSVGYRIGKAIGRRKAVIGMFAVGLGAAGIVAGFGLPKLLRASEDKRKAEEALAAAQREKEREQRRKRAEEKLRFAEQHLEDGNLEAALALATEVIQYDPDFGKAYYVRGSATYLQWKAETIDAAIKDFELADKKNMDFLQAHDHRALWDAAMACLDIKDSVNQAVQFSKRALESTPPQDAAHPQKPFFLLHQSLNAFVEKQYKEAIEHAEEARRLNPKMARAMYLLSMYHSESMISPFNAQGLRQFRDYKKALAYIDGAVQQSPNHFRYLVHSARMNSYAGDSQRGLEHAGRVLTIDPGFSEAHYFKANALFRLDRIEDCLAELNALERKNKGRLEYHHLGLKGTVQFNQRQYDQAMESFTASLKLKESYSAYTYRGQTLMELDKVEEAIADFTTALKMNKEYGSAYLGRGRAYVKLKRYQEALSDFDNAGKHGQPQGYDFKEKVERWLREHEQ